MMLLGLGGQGEGRHSDIFISFEMLKYLSFGFAVRVRNFLSTCTKHKIFDGSAADVTAYATKRKNRLHDCVSNNRVKKCKFTCHESETRLKHLTN